MAEGCKNVAAKLLVVMAACGYVEKGGMNQAQRYKFVQEADVVAQIRKAMIEAKLVIVPSCLEKTYTEVTSNSGSKGHIAHVMMQYTIIDADTGESIIMNMPGDGMDYGDKGIYKAITGANKYALMKLAQMPTGDDPEDDGKEEGKQTAPKPPAPPPAPPQKAPAQPPARPAAASAPAPPAKAPVQQTQQTKPAPEPVLSASKCPSWPDFKTYAGSDLDQIPTPVLLKLADELDAMVRNPTSAAQMKHLATYQQMLDNCILILETRSRADQDLVNQNKAGEEDQRPPEETPAPAAPVQQTMIPETPKGLVGVEAVVYERQAGELRKCTTFKEAFETLNKAINDPVVQAAPKVKKMLEDLFNEEIGPGIRSKK